MEPDDADRLRALRGFEILDTAPEEAFDDIVHVAAYVCGTPMAAVSLVDEHRQWFKARRGLPVVETPRGESFCSHTIEQRGVLEVRDATADPRFADSPLVREPLAIRFYAAAPLVTPDGFAIGTVCVLDREPRRLDSGQRSALLALANQAMAQLVLRQQVLMTQRLEERFRAVVEQSSDLIAFVDGGGLLRYLSPAVGRILGYDEGDLLHRSMHELLDSPAANTTFIRLMETPRAERSAPTDIQLRRANGTIAHLEVRCSNLLEEPAVQAVVFHCRDLSEQRDAEWTLERTVENAVQVLETAQDAYIQIDADGVITDWNRQACVTFGWQRDEALGRSVSGLIIPPELRHRHEHGVVAAAARSSSSGETIFNGLEVTAVRRDGTELPVEVTMWSTVSADGTVRFSSFLRDVTERQALEERLAHHATHDDLTGLPNRYLLRDRLDTALARCARDGTLVGVLFCDVDRFKVINDSSGHSVGDEVLREVGRRLEGAVRVVDTVVRFGGDEFVVIADGVDDEIDVSLLAERVRLAVADPIVVGDLVLPTSLSVGVVVCGGDATAEQIISDADAAMYLAKDHGRDRIEVFDEALRTRVRARFEDERALRRALEQNELRLQYQPIVSVSTGAIVGAEALVRWQRPGHGMLGPGAFVPLAEETGLIVALGDWVIDEACEQLGRWRDRVGDPALTMSVNVAARQVTAGRLGVVVERALRRAGLDPTALTIELTESTLMENLDASMKVLSDLTGTGVSVAIDDFGTGYSSLSYLKTLPIDTLKVDRSFVVNLESDPYDSAIVRAVASIAHALELRVVAEGVETEKQLEQVVAHGCDWAQGYYFARPMDAVDLLALGDILRPSDFLADPD